MAYIDKKEIVWVRYYLEDDVNLEDVNTTDAVLSLIDECYDSEVLDDTFSDLTVENNDGAATVELYDDDGFLIFDNGK